MLSLTPMRQLIAGDCVVRADRVDASIGGTISHFEAVRIEHLAGALGRCIIGIVDPARHLLAPPAQFVRFIGHVGLVDDEDLLVLLLRGTTQIVLNGVAFLLCLQAVTVHLHHSLDRVTCLICFEALREDLVTLLLDHNTNLTLQERHVVT